MKLILVAGLEETNKTKLVQMAVGTLNNGYKDFSHIDISGMDTVRNGFLKLDEIKKSHISLYDELHKVLTDSKRNAFNVVLDCFFTISTPYGYVPLVTDRFFKVFTPDAMILVESSLEDFSGDPKAMRRIKEHQDMNRMYGAKFASELGVPLKIIRVRKDEIMPSVKELQNHLLALTKN